MSVDRKDFWLRIAERFGVPCVILVFVGLSLAKAASWTADNIVTPLVERHIRFIDSTEGAMEDQSAAMQAIGDSTEAIKESVETQTVLVREFIERGSK